MNDKFFIYIKNFDKVVIIPNDLRSLLFRACERSEFISKNCIDFIPMDTSFNRFEYSQNYNRRKIQEFEKKVSEFTKNDKKLYEKEIDKLKKEFELQMNSLE